MEEYINEDKIIYRHARTWRVLTLNMKHSCSNWTSCLLTVSTMSSETLS